MSPALFSLLVLLAYCLFFFSLQRHKRSVVSTLVVIWLVMMSETYKKITIGLSGGCELLFNNEASLSLVNVVPVNTSVTELIALLKRDYIQDRPELFVDASGANVRPGILVVVNGCDVEVMGGVEHVLEDGDEVEFISTLHGG